MLPPHPHNSITCTEASEETEQMRVPKVYAPLVEINLNRIHKTGDI